MVKDISPHNRYQEQLAKAGNKEVLEPFIEKEEHLEQGRTNSTMSKKVKLFISYSHKDEDYREQLDIRLKAIERRFPLEVWHDRNLLAGEQVHEKIVQQLEVADIIVLLISPDFVSSDYCFSHEMEIALKLYEEKKNVVIPIIIRDTDDWYSYQIGNHTALPTDGKPVCDWPNEDKFWSDVQKGIRIQVEKLSQS